MRPIVRSVTADSDAARSLPVYGGGDEGSGGEGGNPGLDTALSSRPGAPSEVALASASRRGLVAAGVAVVAVVLAIAVVATPESGSRPASPAAPPASGSTAPPAAAEPAPAPTTGPNLCLDGDHVPSTAAGLGSCVTELAADRYVRFGDQCLTVFDMSRPERSDLGWLRQSAPWVDLDRGLVLLCAEEGHIVLRGYDPSPPPCLGVVGCVT